MTFLLTCFKDAVLQGQASSIVMPARSANLTATFLIRGHVAVLQHQERLSNQATEPLLLQLASAPDDNFA
jgi:hypothetical protein